MQEQPPPPPSAAKHPSMCLDTGKGKGEARPEGSGQSASSGTYQDALNRSSRTALISCGVGSVGGEVPRVTGPQRHLARFLLVSERHLRQTFARYS